MIKKTLKINGVERILILDKDETLAQVLREHLLLTGQVRLEKMQCRDSLYHFTAAMAVSFCQDPSVSVRSIKQKEN